MNQSSNIRVDSEEYGSHGRSGSVALPLVMVRPASPACFVLADAAARRAERAVEVRRNDADIVKRLSITLPTRLMWGAAGRYVGLFFHDKLKMGWRRGAWGVINGLVCAQAFRIGAYRDYLTCLPCVDCNECLVVLQGGLRGSLQGYKRMSSRVHDRFAIWLSF